MGALQYSVGCCSGGIHAASESFFPTLPSLSTLMEDAAEGFSSLFMRTPNDRRSSNEVDEAVAGGLIRYPDGLSCVSSVNTPLVLFPIMHDRWLKWHDLHAVPLGLNSRVHG